MKHVLCLSAAIIATTMLTACGDQPADYASTDEVAAYRATNCPAPFEIGQYVSIKLSKEVGQIISDGYAIQGKIKKDDLAESACMRHDFRVRFFLEPTSSSTTNLDRYPVEDFHPVELEAAPQK